MKYLNESFNDFVNKKINSSEDLNEARVQYKRKYTDRYPAKTMNTNTKVRAKVLAAMADGVITEEELMGILKELNANPRWYKRNSNLFRITEEGITLSKTGKRMSRHITPKNDITEDSPISEAIINNNEDAIRYLIKNYKEITGNNYSSVNVDDKDIGKIERFLKKNKIKVDSFWDDWIDYDHTNESVNEGAMSEIDIIGKESKNFKEFKSTVLKTYKQLKDSKGLDKWLKQLYDDSKKYV